MKVYCVTVTLHSGEPSELVEIHSTRTGAKEAIELKARSGNLYAKWMRVEEWLVEDIEHDA